MNNNLTRCQSRLQKELQDIKKFEDTLTVEVNKNKTTTWRVSFKGAEDTLYSGESYTLQFKFSNEYPIDSPEVIFVGDIPAHEHIYSNGYICLSILFDGWTPALRVSSVCMSIISMLSSATEKKRPPDDDYFSAKYTKGPKSVTWIFDDDKV